MSQMARRERIRQQGSCIEWTKLFELFGQNTKQKRFNAQKSLKKHEIKQMTQKYTGKIGGVTGRNLRKRIDKV